MSSSVGEQIFPYDPPTVIGIFMHQARRFGDKTMSLAKKNGCWEPMTWLQAKVMLPGGVMGLYALGFQKGDTVGILSHTRREWSAADFSILAAGGVTVGLYPSASLWEMTHVISHSGLKICFAEDDAMLDRLLEIRSQTGRPEKIIVFETGRSALPEGVMTRDTFMEQGQCLHWSDPARFETVWQAVRPSDLATIAYTSGTTGPPKGVMITHANLYYTAINTAQMHHYEDGDFGLAFLPLTHMLQRMSVYLALHTGLAGAYAESIDKLMDNFQELRPTLQVGVPQIFERIYNRIHQMMEAGSPLRRRIFRRAMEIGMQAARLRREHQPLPAALAVQDAVAKLLVFRKIQNVFGGRVKYLMCGGAPMPLYLLEFFHAVGLLILEGYGLTETVAPVSVNRAECFKFGTVGQLIPGMEAKLAPDGELLLRGKGLFCGYYKDPAATAAAIDADGWFSTGDIATIDDEGFIRITDRKKDIIVTAGGKNISPQNIESLLRTLPLLGHVLIFGDRRKYLTALMTLDRHELEDFVRRENPRQTDDTSLAEHPQVQKIVADHVSAVNSRLAPFEQIKRYKILPHDFTEATGELTPTLKLRRREIIKKYSEDIEDLYKG